MSEDKKKQRAIIRQKKQKRHQQQRILMIGAIIIFVLGVAALLIYPSVKPVGEIKEPQPNDRPEIQGSSTGKPDAPVKVLEFADFQCPACVTFSETREPILIDNYIKTGKVNYTFYPFSFIGNESFAAAEAAYCALDQNKFWEFHDIIFANFTGENVGDNSDRRLEAYAAALNLDTKEFNTCYKNGKYTSKVKDDISYGRTFGINQTPSFVVNGKLVTSGDLFTTIDQILASSGS